MSDRTKAYVVDLLESYPKRMQKIALLHYELEHPARVSTDEMTGAMSFSHGDGGVRSGGYVSNKTLYIALNYQDKTEKINTDTTDEIVKRLVSMEQEQERLVYYISLLDQQQKRRLSGSILKVSPGKKLLKSSRWLSGPSIRLKGGH